MITEPERVTDGVARDRSRPRLTPNPPRSRLPIEARDVTSWRSAACRRAAAGVGGCPYGLVLGLEVRLNLRGLVEHRLSILVRVLGALVGCRSLLRSGPR